MRCLRIIVLFLGSVSPRHVRDESIRRWVHALPVPWVGLLSHKHDRESVETIAGIILIGTKMALGNANEVSIIKKANIRNTTKAMFLSDEGKVEYAAVTGYVIHPEFDEVTLNTFALLILDYDEDRFQWQLMEWPQEYSKMNEYPGDVYYLGYTDRHKALEQIMYKMEPVDKSNCSEFYKNEKLDSKWMAPARFQCYRNVFHGEPCLFESGMALAALHKSKWTLLGMSVLGPGCALPARFIRFAHYVPWVLASSPNRPSRRVIPGVTPDWPNYDKIIMQMLNNHSIVMRPYSDEEVIYGNCTKFDGELMYHEKSEFKAPQYAVGVYGLTLWDDNYLNISCARLTVISLERSLNPFSFDFGLAQYDEDLEGLVRVIPMIKKDETLGTKVVHSSDGPWLSWWYRNDTQKESSVVFKFSFYKKATIKLEVYGARPPVDEAEDKFLKTLGDYDIDEYKRPKRPLIRPW